MRHSVLRTYPDPLAASDSSGSARPSPAAASAQYAVAVSADRVRGVSDSGYDLLILLSPSAAVELSIRQRLTVPVYSRPVCTAYSRPLQTSVCVAFSSRSRD